MTMHGHRLLAMGVLVCALSAPALSQKPITERQVQSLSLAIKANDFSFVSTMKRLGLGPQARDSLGNTPLMIAIREQGVQMILLMLEDPAWQEQVVLEHENQIGENAVMLAALNGQTQVLKRLIGLGAQVNREGWTALHYAATSGHLDTLALLIDHSAYIDAESPNRTTPLMMAARFNHTDAAKLLLQAGADPTITNDAGFKARDYAVEGNNKDLEFVLQLEEIAFENKYINQTFGLDPSATLEEIVIESGGSVVTEAGATRRTKEVAPGEGAEVFQGIQ